MSNTLEERDAMIDMAMGAGYHITHIVHIIDYMVDFDKASKGMPRDKKLKLLEEDRWLGSEDFKRYDTHLYWLDILDMDKDEWNKIVAQGRKMLEEMK
jgi:hypothetical protein